MKQESSAQQQEWERRRAPFWRAIGFWLPLVNSTLETYRCVARMRELTADEREHRAALRRWQGKFTELYELIRKASDDDRLEWFAMALLDLGEFPESRVPIPLRPGADAYHQQLRQLQDAVRE